MHGKRFNRAATVLGNGDNWSSHAKPTRLNCRVIIRKRSDRERDGSWTYDRNASTEIFFLSFFFINCPRRENSGIGSVTKLGTRWWMSLLITLGRVYPKGFVPKLRCSLSWAEAGKSIIEVTKKSWKEGISSYSYVTLRLNHVNIEIRIVCIFYLSLFFFFCFLFCYRIEYF